MPILPPWECYRSGAALLLHSCTVLNAKRSSLSWQMRAYIQTRPMRHGARGNQNNANYYAHAMPCEERAASRQNRLALLCFLASPSRESFREHVQQLSKSRKAANPTSGPPTYENIWLDSQEHIHIYSNFMRLPGRRDCL